VSAPERFRLDGKVALVIAGTSGIGQAIDVGYREAGARVLVEGRTPAKLPATDACLCDVRDLAALADMVARVIADHGRTEWAGRGVRVNAIAPGFVLTDLNREKMAPERKALAVARRPMGRFGETDDMVGAAIYLASPAAQFVTGETIRVDGGFLAAGL